VAIYCNRIWRIREINIAEEDEVEWQVYTFNCIVVVIESKSRAAATTTRVDEVESPLRKIRIRRKRVDSEEGTRRSLAKNRHCDGTIGCSEGYNRRNCVHARANDARRKAIELNVDILRSGVEMIALNDHLSCRRSTER